MCLLNILCEENKIINIIVYYLNYCINIEFGKIKYKM